MRPFSLCLLLPALAAAAVWPETIGDWKRAEVAPAAVTDRPVWDEYGLKEAETATFENGDRKFTATGYRLVDPTGAMAALQWQTPATPQKGRIAAHGNFLFSFANYQPSAAEFTALTNNLRNLDTTPLPALPGFLPSANVVPGSLRYILGPVSLEKFTAGIPPSVAAFSMGAEAQVGVISRPQRRSETRGFQLPDPADCDAKGAGIPESTGSSSQAIGSPGGRCDGSGGPGRGRAIARRSPVRGANHALRAHADA